MKIRTFRRLVGLAAIGGVAYVHKQRGGEWTIASIRDTLRHLWGSLTTMVAPIKDGARDSLARAANVIDTPVRSGLSDDLDPRSYGDYSTRKDDTSRH